MDENSSSESCGTFVELGQNEGTMTGTCATSNGGNAGIRAFGKRSICWIADTSERWIATLRSAVFVDGKLSVSALWAIVLLLWIPMLLLPLHSPEGGVLRGDWTDHYHHNYAAWAFLKRGISIYRMPLGAWKAGYPYEYLVHWPDHPFEYPPGCLLVFLPTALWGRFVPMTYNNLGTSLVLYLLALSQVSFAAVLLLLRECVPGGKALVALYCWSLMTHIALTGFYDATWVGFAAMMLLRMKQKRTVDAIYWFAAACFLSYRAAALAPFLGMCLWRLYRERPKGYWIALGTMAVVGIMDVLVFVAILRATKAISRTKDYVNITLVQMQTDNPRFVFAMVVLSIGVALALFARSWVTAAALIIATYLIHLNGGHFWRMCLLIAYPLSAVAFTREEHASWHRGASVIVSVLMGAAFTMVTPGDTSIVISDIALSLPSRSVLFRTLLAAISISVGVLLLGYGRRLRQLEKSPILERRMQPEGTVP
ncbi:MAG: hypothetical protein QM784_36045 [Polyangiaceae bacterium]